MSTDIEVAEIANLAHEYFRRSYRNESNPTAHTKITTDTEWIERHQTNVVDMVATDYYHLPRDWQMEREAGARIALECLRAAQAAGGALDESFIEATAALLHEKWLLRNSGRADEIHKLAYVNLPEYQKEKDRFFVYACMDYIQAKQARL